MEEYVCVFGRKIAKFKATKRYVRFENLPSFIHCSDSRQVLGKCCASANTNKCYDSCKPIWLLGFSRLPQDKRKNNDKKAIYRSVSWAMLTLKNDCLSISQKENQQPKSPYYKTFTSCQKNLSMRIWYMLPKINIFVKFARNFLKLKIL